VVEHLTAAPCSCGKVGSFRAIFGLMKRLNSFAGTLILTAGLCAALTLPGCYKTEMETQKTRADKAEGDAKANAEKLAKAATDLEQAKAQLNQMRRGTLITLVNGQQAGTDEIIMTQPGVFVRSGSRQRVGSKVTFDNGRIADQQLTVQRETGKTNFTGSVRSSRPDGEWLWYDPKGVPAVKEVWKEGKLAQVFNAASVRGETVTWKELSKADREKWFRSTANIFSNLPELVRELDVAPAPAVPAKPDAAKPATGIPAKKATTPPKR